MLDGREPQDAQGTRIVAIDTWLGSPEHVRELGQQRELGYPRLYTQFLANVRFYEADGLVYPFPISSVQGGHFLEQNGVLADIIYIDAGHEYEAVLLDIIVFWRILRPGGTMLLDDFTWPGVQRAVTEFASASAASLESNGNVARIIKHATPPVDPA
jgi:SAM-dependent methyltransferase